MTRQAMMTLVLCTLLATAAHGFNGERYTVEPITVVIGDMPVISERGAPVAVGVTVSNSSDAAVDCMLHTRMTDGWATQEPDEIPLTVPAQGDAAAEIHVICPEHAISASVMLLSSPQADGYRVVFDDASLQFIADE